MQLLTSKLTAKELVELKKLMLRPGFVEEWNHLDSQAADFSKILLAKENAAPSATYTLFTTYPAEAVLWLGFTSKQAAVKEKYENFLKVWPLARQKVPYALMLEMRITPELPGYTDLVKSIFLQLIDGGLTTTEELKALLEPHSPPAPPPPVTIKRTRAKKGAEAKAKARIDDDDEDEDSDDLAGDDEDDEEDDDLDSLDLGGDDIDLAIGLDDPGTPLIAADGDDDDDVFARDSVSDDDLDTELDSDVEPDSDDEADRDNESPDDPPPPTRKVAKKKIASRRSNASSESERDYSTAAGAGLKALALALDLDEPSDPADLDESDPIFELEEDEGERVPRTKQRGKASPKVPAKAAKKAPAKPAKAKASSPTKKR
jgi:hypothetical protein